MADNKVRFFLEIKEKGLKIIENFKDDIKEISKTVSKSSKSIEDYGDDINETTKEVSKMSKALGKLKDVGSKTGQTLSKFGKSAIIPAAAIGASTAAIAVYSKTIIDAVNAQKLASERAGVSYNDFQAFADVAQSVGVPIESLADKLRQLNEYVVEAATQGTGEAVEVFKILKLDAEELAKLSPEKQLERIANALRSVPRNQQMQLLDQLSIDDLAPVVDRLDDIVERRDYLARNGLSLGNASDFEDFEKMLSGINADIKIFSALVVKDLLPAINEAFAGKPGEDNTLLNAETAKNTAEGLLLIIKTFNLMAQSVGYVATLVQGLTLDFVSLIGKSNNEKIIKGIEEDNNKIQKDLINKLKESGYEEALDKELDNKTFKERIKLIEDITSGVRKFGVFRKDGVDLFDSGKRLAEIYNDTVNRDYENPIVKDASLKLLENERSKQLVLDSYLNTDKKLQNEMNKKMENRIDGLSKAIDSFKTKPTKKEPTKEETEKENEIELKKPSDNIVLDIGEEFRKKIENIKINFELNPELKDETIKKLEEEYNKEIARIGLTGDIFKVDKLKLDLKKSITAIKGFNKEIKKDLSTNPYDLINKKIDETLLKYELELETKEKTLNLIDEYYNELIVLKNLNGSNVEVLETEIKKRDTIKKISEEQKEIEIDKLDIISLQIELLNEQGNIIEATELERIRALESINSTMADVESKTKALDLTNKIFDIKQLRNNLSIIEDDISKLQNKLNKSDFFSSERLSIEDELNNKIKERTELQKALNIEQEEGNNDYIFTVERINQLNEELKSSFLDIFSDFASGTKSATEAFNEFATFFLKKISEMVLEQLYLNAISSLGGGTGGTTAGLGSSFLSLFSSMPVFDGGGIVGKTQPMLQVPGLTDSTQSLAIVQRGEQILTKNQQNNNKANSSASSSGVVNNTIILDSDSIAKSSLETQSGIDGVIKIIRKNSTEIKNLLG